MSPMAVEPYRCCLLPISVLYHPQIYSTYVNLLQQLRYFIFSPLKLPKAFVKSIKHRYICDVTSKAHFNSAMSVCVAACVLSPLPHCSSLSSSIMFLTRLINFLTNTLCYLNKGLFVHDLHILMHLISFDSAI